MVLRRLPRRLYYILILASLTGFKCDVVLPKVYFNYNLEFLTSPNTESSATFGANITTDWHTPDALSLLLEFDESVRSLVTLGNVSILVVQNSYIIDRTEPTSLLVAGTAAVSVNLTELIPKVYIMSEGKLWPVDIVSNVNNDVESGNEAQISKIVPNAYVFEDRKEAIRKKEKESLGTGLGLVGSQISLISFLLITMPPVVLYAIGWRMRSILAKELNIDRR